MSYVENMYKNFHWKRFIIEDLFFLHVGLSVEKKTWSQYMYL